MSRFVKSADTRTTVASSRAQLSKLLLRYGASAVSMSEDFEKREIVVSFIVPNSPIHGDGSARVPVRLPISIDKVAFAMFPFRALTARKAKDGGGWNVEEF